MKAIGLPPSDPRVRQMNDAQWLWCYFNEVEDEKEEADNWKARFDYLTYFINFDMAKSVHEAEGTKKKKSKYTTNGLHSNADFDKEIKAASLGYEPSSGLTVDEFLAQHEKGKSDSVDIANDSFEDLLASGEFVEVADHTQGIGNKNEDLDDFLDRAFEYENYLVEQDRQRMAAKDSDLPIDENDWDIFNSNHEDSNDPDKSQQDQRTQEEIIQEAIDLDLDLFDIDDDD